MNDKNGITRIAIVILAVVCVVLAAVYVAGAADCSGGAGNNQQDLSGYGQDQPQDGSDGYEVISGSDGNYIVTDDDTMEMDEIPMGADGESTSGSDTQ